MTSQLTAPAGRPAAGSTMLAFVGPLLAGAVLAVLGLVAGAGARLLLARLRRGVRVRPPWCELAVASAWGAAGAALGAGILPPAFVPVLLGLGWLLAAAGAVDVIAHRLPDALTLPALPVALLLLVPLGAAAVLRGMAGAALLVGVHGVVHLVAPRALGAGDVKLAAPVGAVVGAASVASLPVGVLLAAVITGLVAAVGLASGRLARGAEVPHGPAMLAEGWLVVAGTGFAAAAR